MANKYPNYSGTVRMQSIYRMSDAPPNWAQDDPTQPDYIANKDEAEKLRPISVDGEPMLDDTHESGGLNFVSGDNVTLTAEGNSIRISARGGGESTDTVRPIQVEGEEVLNDSSESGALNLVGGKNVTLFVSGNSVVISASGSGEGGGGDCDCPEIIEGEGIDVVENLKGQKVISLEKGAITDDYIDSISFEKIKMSEKTTLILNGGKANDSDN
jgi:hypothetical protein